MEPIKTRVAELNGAVLELNGKLARLRAQLFGEGESSPQPTGPSEMPALDALINEIADGLAIAHAQIDCVLQRL